MSGMARKAAGNSPGHSPGKGRAAHQRTTAQPRVVPVGAGGQQVIATTVAGLHYELVDVERGQRGLLRVTIDRIPGHVYVHGGAPDHGTFVTVDDCEAVTRQLQYALEVEGLEYARLEVSSPGLDRPLKTEADYDRFAGQTAAVTLKLPFEGRKKWEGVLSKGEGDAWSLSFKNGKAEQVLGFTLAEVREARLVPVLDFKGRKSRVEGADGGGDQTPATAGADGGE
jgi:ribosome maturation factor RimP